MRKFDLNIEQILESWETYHAVREVLANALDEHLLTRSDKKVQIDKEDGVWIIRDFGRGLQYTHLTQNESDEKHQNPHVIGMFGIGLKDALATFKRRGIDVQIESKFAGITTDWAPKEGFSDVSTLHALVYSPADPEFIGTKFVLKRLKDEDMA
ncbi:ATP-binding protein, partial [Acidithiobacillus ferrooxidans]|nr:ATP-binding protein [Acidithiobacillus ferrooxidans]